MNLDNLGRTAIAAAALCATGAANGAVVVDYTYGYGNSSVAIFAPGFDDDDADTKTDTSPSYIMSTGVVLGATFADGSTGSGHADSLSIVTNGLASGGAFTSDFYTQTHANSDCVGNCSQVSAQAQVFNYTNFTTDVEYNFTAELSTLLSGATFQLGSVYLQDLTTNLFLFNWTSFDSGTTSLVGSLPQGSYSLYGTLYGESDALDGDLISGTGSGTFNFEVTPVPLPAAAWLLLSGLGGVGALARRRRIVAVA